MHLPIKNICALGILPIAIALWNCTTDGETVTVGSDELSDIQIIDDSIFDESDEDEEDEAEEAKSSSSTKEEKSSSSKKSSAKSSSSTKADSSQSETDEDSDSDKVSSSSSQKASSSSTKRILVPGVEESGKKDESSSSKAKSSSSKAKSSSSKAKSSSSKAESSSSEEEVVTPSLSPIDSAIFESMETISNSEQKEINRLITNKDSSFTKNESDSLDLSLLDYEQNDYLCKASDDKWHGITKNTIDCLTEVLYGRKMTITKTYMYSFSDICNEIYIRSKKAE